MDGLARSARRAALVSVACASVLFACVLIWNLMPGGVMGDVATWTLAAVLALVLLPIASLVAWEVDRRAAARAAKQDLDRALRDWAALTALEPKTAMLFAEAPTPQLTDPTPSRQWSTREGAAPPPARSTTPEFRGDSKTEQRPDLQPAQPRHRDPAAPVVSGTPRRVTHPHRRAVRNR